MNFVMSEDVLARLRESLVDLVSNSSDNQFRIHCMAKLDGIDRTSIETRLDCLLRRTLTTTTTSTTTNDAMLNHTNEETTTNDDDELLNVEVEMAAESEFKRISQERQLINFEIKKRDDFDCLSSNI